MEPVIVKSELPIDGKDVMITADGKSVILSKQSPYRFITIQPVLLNHERLNNHIETLMNNPYVDAPEVTDFK